MSKFNRSDIQIQSEDALKPNEIRVMKVDRNAAPEITPFQMNALKNPSGATYSSVKSKFGSLAVTDEDRRERGQKDRRFSLNPLLRGPLSVEEEERRVIDEKVKAGIEAATAEARAQGAKEGYAEGLKQGHEEAYRRFQEEGSARLSQLEALIVDLDSKQEEIFRANERFLIELVYRISRMVMLRELKTDREYVLRLASEVIEKMGVRENISLRIHPDDLASVAMLKEGLEKHLGTLKNLNIEASPQVQTGGCIVETEWSAVDASIDAQLENVYESLIGKGVV